MSPEIIFVSVLIISSIFLISVLCWANSKVPFGSTWDTWFHEVNGKNIRFSKGNAAFGEVIFLYSGEAVLNILTFGHRKTIICKGSDRGINGNLVAYHVITFWVGMAFWITVVFTTMLCAG